MSVKYEPQLTHLGFDWVRQPARFDQDLRARETVILEKLGFYSAYGSLDDPNFTGHIESMRSIEELSGLLCKAGAIMMDGSFKPPHQIIATLRRIEADPSIAFGVAIEPEALGVLASCYQRAEEKPGTFWLDIYRDGAAPLPQLNRITAAARAGILKMLSEAAPGRRKNHAIKFLAFGFREIFLRYNAAIARHSLDSSRDGNKIQIDGGPFFDFVSEVLKPFNEFCLALATEYGVKPVSAGSLTQVAWKNSIGNYHHKFPL